MTPIKWVVLFLLLLADCFLNWFPLLGSFFESMSARAARMRAKPQRQWGWTADAIDWGARTFFGQDNHCATQLAREQRYGGAWGAFLALVRGIDDAKKGTAP